MAEAFCNAFAKGKVIAMSAGTRPAARVDPQVVKVMHEAGYDLHGRQPKALTPATVQGADMVVIMSCEDEPLQLSVAVKVRRWDLPDPRGQPIDVVRSIRDAVRQSVSELLADLAPLGQALPRVRGRELAGAGFLLILVGIGIAAAYLVAGARGLAFAGLAGIAGLAFANGANDLPKTVATLVGSRVTSYRNALAIGTVATAVGGGLAILWSGALLRLFSSGGIITVDGSLHLLFPVVVIAGAGGWVLLATRFGLPVSTTHALIGASVGAALAARGAEGVIWGTLAMVVSLPLIAAPLVAVPLGFGISRAIGPNSSRGRGSTHRIPHLLSAAGSSAARALNDTPKIAGVGLLVFTVSRPTVVHDVGPYLIVLTVLAMAAGGLWASRRVNQTLAVSLVNMDARNGLAANVSNSLLVGAGSFLGLPLSTTHVSGGAMVGAAMGSRERGICWNVARDIAAAWVVTVPGAAGLALSLWWLLRGLALLT